MISVIICSVNKKNLADVCHNIAQTIGVVHEIIPFDNSGASLGICEVYNRGAGRARYDILCFMHEDVSFETTGWGTKVADHLSDQSVGLIGVAGGDTKSLVPSSWSSQIFPSEISIVQHYKRERKDPLRISKTGYPDNHSVIKTVACIDGVWMCTRRDVFDQYKFDDKTFRGFHGYDIDLSLQVLSSYKVCVVSDIIMHHFSEGSYNNAWVENMVLLSDKWKHRLPVSVRELSYNELCVQHWTVMKTLSVRLTELDYPLFRILSYCFKYSFNKYFRIPYFIHCLKYIFLIRLKGSPISSENQ